MLKLCAKWGSYWLREVIPILFFMSGLLSVFYIDTQSGFVVGVLLLIVAGLIWIFRKDQIEF